MPRASAASPTRYYALIVPGLASIASTELEAAGARRIEVLSPRDRRADLLLFESSDIGPILHCGTLEDVFVVAFDRTIDDAVSVAALAASLDLPTLEHSMRAHHAVRPKRTARSYGVVARMAGRHRFRREDIGRAFERAFGRLLPRWTVRADPTVEIWVHVLAERAVCGIRLTADSFAQRTWKRSHLPASLKPTVARALVMLSEPRHGDIVLDPMCGAGTILRERAEAGRGARLVGGDLATTAVKAARENAGRQATLARWDAGRLPLQQSTVYAVICNVPYGRQHGAGGGLPQLYDRMLKEAARVLRTGGRCVVLTGEPEMLVRALPSGLRVRSKQRWLLRGLAVTAFVMVRG